VLNKLIGKTLALWGYNLSEGHCRALKQAFEHLNGKVTRILLENCGVSDDEFTQILLGIQKITLFDSIIYK
jgi:hypothetical protein